jgi:hypothetical protein
LNFLIHGLDGAVHLCQVFDCLSLFVFKLLYDAFAHLLDLFLGAVELLEDHVLDGLHKSQVNIIFRTLILLHLQNHNLELSVQPKEVHCGVVLIVK